MATVTQTNTASGGFLGGKGTRTFTLDDANDETQRIPLSRGETCLIHATGLTANTCSAQVLCYVDENATGVAVDFSGTTTFTTDFALGFTAPGKCSITVKETVDAGTGITVSITK